MSKLTSSFVTRSAAALGSVLICMVLLVPTLSVDDTRLQHPDDGAFFVAAPQG